MEESQLGNYKCREGEGKKSERVHAERRGVRREDSGDGEMEINNKEGKLDVEH